MSRKLDHWRVFRPWERHGLVLITGGFVYIFTGLSLTMADGVGLQQERALSVAVNIMPLRSWGVIFVAVGMLAAVSSRWPGFWTHAKGYMILSGLASGWSAVYLLSWLLGHAPPSNLNYGALWGLQAFMWWAVSGLLNPPKRVRNPNGPD